MASINSATREITCKVVYYGPGMSGKTTNLQMIHHGLPETNRGQLVTLDTQQERTLFFDFLPIDLGTIEGYTTKFQLYTVPGQVYYNATRKLVLRGVDGIVFVADSQPDKMEENLESLDNLRENLSEYGYRLEEIPHVFQYNKQDLPGALSPHDMQKALNPGGEVPSISGVAAEGKGVKDTLKIVASAVLRKLRHQIQSLTEGSTAAATAVSATASVATAAAGGGTTSAPPPRLRAKPQGQQGAAPPARPRKMIDPAKLRAQRPQLRRRPSAASSPGQPPRLEFTQVSDVFWRRLRIGRATIHIEPRANHDGEGAHLIDADLRLWGFVRRSQSGPADPADPIRPGHRARLVISGQNGSAPEVLVEIPSGKGLHPRAWMRLRSLRLVPQGESLSDWPTDEDLVPSGVSPEAAPTQTPKDEN
jgi:signal recognition particle receptor subunit beta